MDKFDYSQLPEHMVASIERYVTRKIEPGGFLTAIITNDLQGAVSHADDTNLPLIPVYVTYMYNKTPAGCWGHENSMKYWMSREEEN